MYFETVRIKQYHLDRQRELTKAMQNTRHDHAELTTTISHLLKRVGLWLSLIGERLQLEQKQLEM
ncbi:MAG: hypothetical protein AAF702_01740 [Chloroflexota bacterium]